MVEPELADDVVLFAPRREVVHHYRRPGCEQSDDLLAVHLGALLAAAVVEEQVERRLRRHQLVPVALEHADVLVFGEELGRGCGELRVDLDGHEGDRGWERGDDPGRADATAGAELSDTRTAALRRKDVEEPAHLRYRRVREAEPALELERPGHEGRFLHRSRLGGVLPVPAHFEPERVGEVWRVPYEERAREAEA